MAPLIVKPLTLYRQRSQRRNVGTSLEVSVPYISNGNSHQYLSSSSAKSTFNSWPLKWKPKFLRNSHSPKADLALTTDYCQTTNQILNDQTQAWSKRLDFSNLYLIREIARDPFEFRLNPPTYGEFEDHVRIWEENLELQGLRYESCESKDAERSVAPAGSLIKPRHNFLEHLPAKLILRVQDFLPPSNLLSLRYTCRRFFHQSNISVADLFPNSIRDKDIMAMRTEGYEFLLMLERDGKLTHNFICSLCESTHPPLSFTLNALRHPASERKCRVSQETMWICPHNQWDRRWQFISGQRDWGTFLLAPRSKTTLRYTSKPIGCGDWRPCNWIGEATFMQWHPLLANRSGMYDELRVSKALRILNLWRCPHMIILDPDMTKTFSPGCTFLPWTRCECWECVLPQSTRQCVKCQVSLEFEIEDHWDGRKVLSVMFREKCKVIHAADPRYGYKDTQLAFRSSLEPTLRQWGRRSHGL